jgi:O-antigen ligase
VNLNKGSRRRRHAGEGPNLANARGTPGTEAEEAIPQWQSAFAGLAGAWLGVALLKFGNPVIFDDQIDAPNGLLQLLIQPWPFAWGLALFGAVALAGGATWRWRPRPPMGIVILPGAWLFWQILSALQSVDPRLTGITVIHFVICAACFYLGVFALSRIRNLGWLWLGWTAGFALVLADGLHQHFGGLEETRRWFLGEELPKFQTPPPPEFLQKLLSDRIYATLFYPNALAGAILLVLPVACGVLWQTERLTKPARFALISAVVAPSLSCLYWSGSKAGWLIFLVLAGAAFVHTRIKRTINLTVLVLVVVAGLGGFWVRHHDYMARGATSMTARLECWKATLQIMSERPVLGSGPGTFGVMYRRIKPQEAEMAKLAHNDYLQQGSDAGLLGLVAYFGIVAGSLACLYRNSRVSLLRFAVWMGLCASALQGLVEFGLFIPALAWPQFLLLGWLWGSNSNRQEAAPPLISPAG